MRATVVTLLVISWIGFSAALASGEFVIPPGATPSLDGKAGEEEWADAAQVRLVVDSKATVQVRVKHDQESLFLAFRFKDNRHGALIFPEVLVDPGHDQGAGWESDDWWLHVSGTDCEARGAFSDYSNCKADHPDWRGVPNYELSETPPPLEEIEMRIALAKLGITTERPFGVSITVELVPDGRAFWPEGAALESPATWATAVLGAE